MVENEHASAVALEESHGVLCADVRVVAGRIWPPACTLSGSGLAVAHEGEAAAFELIAIDQYGNAATSGGEFFELRAYRLLPGGQRRRTRVEVHHRRSNRGPWQSLCDCGGGCCCCCVACCCCCGAEL